MQYCDSSFLIAFLPVLLAPELSDQTRLTKQAFQFQLLPDVRAILSGHADAGSALQFLGQGDRLSRHLPDPISQGIALRTPYRHSTDGLVELPQLALHRCQPGLAGIEGCVNRGHGREPEEPIVMAG